jgi:hypothetical protein
MSSTSCIDVCPASISLNKKIFTGFNVFLSGALSFVTALALNNAIQQTITSAIEAGEGSDQGIDGKKTEKVDNSKLWRNWVVAIILLVVSVGLILLLDYIGSTIP